MPINWTKYTCQLELGPSTTIEEIHSAELALHVTFTEQYVDFLLQHNGSEGCVGPKCNSYISFYRVNELMDRMNGYKVADFAPGYLLFATNLGGEAYVFDTRLPHHPIYRLPFIGMGTVEPDFRGNTFQEFLEILYTESPDDLSDDIRNMELGAPATEAAIEEAESALNVTFDEDYKDFLLSQNGHRDYSERYRKLTFGSGRLNACSPGWRNSTRMK